MTLSVRSTESIKTGLAVVIAYAIALQLGWEKPYWAAFAVIMISLDTAGQSLNKGALRMMGTVVAATAAMVFMAMFAQDRWAMIAAVSVYCGLCTYMMTGSKRPYFWFVTAFVCVVIIIDTTPATSLRAFQIAVARLEETAMGIFVYSLISVLLWPRSSRGNLETHSVTLSAVQGQLFQAYRQQMRQSENGGDVKSIQQKQVQLVRQVGLALNAAETDSYLVWESRHAWRRFFMHSSELMECLEHWRESFPELRSLNVDEFLPNLPAFEDELESRFAQIEAMLRGEAPTEKPTPITIVVNRTALSALTHFQRAALAVTKSQLDRLEIISRSLIDCAAEIQGFLPQDALPKKRDVARMSFDVKVDLNRIAMASRVMFTTLAGYFIWILFDPPGHALFGFMVFLWTAGCVMMRISPVRIVPGFVLGIAVGTIAYMFVMPHLSHYYELATMLFVVTAGIFYLYWPPPKRLTGIAALAVFTILVGISNEQTYDVANLINTCAAMLISIALVIVLFHIPWSPRPEKLFLRLLRRFFRQTEFMLSRLAADRDQRIGLSERWQMAIYGNDLLELPQKLAVIGAQIDNRVLPDATEQRVQALVTTIHALAFRIKSLSEARNMPHAPRLVELYQDELRAWRQVIQEQCRLWATDPTNAMAEVAELERRLALRLERLETHLSARHGEASSDDISEREFENFFRYLGTLRSVTEAGIAFAKTAETIDWPRWQEARF
jgi:uncharacterized membrane protein YccC